MLDVLKIGKTCISIKCIKKIKISHFIYLLLSLFLNEISIRNVHESYDK